MGRIIQNVILIIAFSFLLAGCASLWQCECKKPDGQNIHEWVCWYYDPITLWWYDVDCSNWRNKNDE